MASTNLINAGHARRWASALLQKCNLDAQQADIVADVLVSANLRGIDTHGIVMIRHYVRRFTRISTRPVSIMRENDATCLIDAGDNYGMLASVFAMNKAIEKAKKHGAGVASVHRSNHFGMAAYYALMAAKQGCVGIATTGAGARIPPWGGTKPFLGNNPIAIAVPCDEFPFVLDIALSVVAYQKIVTAAREKTPLPEGWAYDKDGQPTTDHQAALDGMLTAMGGYKGVGLSVMTDLLNGALSQSSFADTILSVDKYDHPRGNGHFFMAVDVESFLPLPLFKSLVKSYSDRFHAIPARPGADVLLPGEREHRTAMERETQGFPLSPAALKQLDELADEFGVATLARLPS